MSETSTPSPPIPFVDLRAQYLAQQPAIDAALAHCLDSGWYVLGRQTTAFEQEFAAYIDAEAHPGAIAPDTPDTPDAPRLQCVGVNSGTDALHLALRACGIGPGDEVITVSHTAVATAAAIVLTGATPVFVDIEPDTYTLDPARLEQALSPRTKAVIPVHLYGHPARLDAILSLARQAEIFVIEDCAQAHGAHFGGRTVGNWGDLACFSFYPTKNLGALGDGGAVIGRNPQLMHQVRLLREYGWTPQARYVSQVHGMNSRLDELQAAILRVKLAVLDEWNARRRRLAALYAETLPDSLILPQVWAASTHVYHLYVIRLPGLAPQSRDRLRQRLDAQGIGTGIHYPVPIHQQPAFAQMATSTPTHPLPISEQIAQEILSLPMHPLLGEDQVHRIAQAISRAL